MSQKSYVIRKLAFHYNDECSYVHCSGGIEAYFQDKEEATQRYKALECKAFRNEDLFDLEQLHPCGDGDEETWLALNNYFVESFGEPFLEPDDEGNYDFYHDVEIYIPDHATDDQIWTIREMTGIRFHELAEFDRPEPVFYTIWLPTQNEYYGYDEEAPRLFNSYDYALRVVKNSSYLFNEDIVLKGELEDLSNQPILLEALISKHSGLSRTKRSKNLKIKKDGETLVVVNDLLKQPLFEIKEYSIEDAKKIDHSMYEEM
ncbi:hypothetical protein H0A36_28370 [Endozoicomonas sp. SM1973]|uniref:Uncharacterized protein n=1 Tax=Spartinivicinus marinus TaxID=2994442 RepID=A0A853IIS4_9GAMM|nr:hypothetical protein [Spartinivicinus marinus]MCX4030358.1 hypothetical protein [Spartinivicinus marinus]NYZ69934.1 hypothetical protein [Spartinivicinus marinus]